MNIDLMVFRAHKVTIFCFGIERIKSREHHLEPVVLLRYPDQEICAVSHLEQYIEKTRGLWKDQNFLISFVKPHKRITTSTIFKWCVTVSKNAGVGVTVF